MKCSFCGHEFGEEEIKFSCDQCIFKKNCELVRCPNCHYEMVADPAWFKSLRAKRTEYVEGLQTPRATGRGSGEGPSISNQCVSLAFLEVAQKGIISHVQAKAHGDWQKIIAMHLLPGTEIELTQKFPSYVFRIGRSQFAIDESLASIVYVRVVEK